MKLKNILLTLLTVLMLLAVGLAVPLGTITEAAQQQYTEESAGGDELDFL